MKIKFKFTTQNIFKIIFLSLIIVNLIFVFFIIKFVKSQVYETMFMSREELLQQSNLSVEDVDIEGFNEVIEKIDKKNTVSDIELKNNIFQN